MDHDVSLNMEATEAVSVLLRFFVYVFLRWVGPMLLDHDIQTCADSLYHTQVPGHVSSHDALNTLRAKLTQLLRDLPGKSPKRKLG